MTKEVPQTALTVDTLLFSVSSVPMQDTRKLPEKNLSILMVKRQKAPFIGQWCLPGGFVKNDETLNQAADRVLAKETNLHDIYKEQVYAFSDVDRDPRMRVVSIAFLSLVDRNKIQETLDPTATWFVITFYERDNMIITKLSNDNETIHFTATKGKVHLTSDTDRYDTVQNDMIAFDHCQMILSGLSTLRHKAKYTNIMFNLMPQNFTLGELQQVYETIAGRPIWAPAFRRLTADRVEKTGATVHTGGHRPSQLYTFKPLNQGEEQ